MKIVQVVGTMNRGGAETMIMNVFYYLKDKHQFIFLINKRKGDTAIGDYDELIRCYGGEIHYIDAMWEIGLRRYLSEFKTIMQKIDQVDVVHSHLNSKGGVIAKAAYLSGIPKVIVHSHAVLKFDGSLLFKLKSYTELLYQKILINRYATDFCACSPKAMYSLFNRENRESKSAFVVNNALILEKCVEYDKPKANEYEKKWRTSRDTKVLGCVGRIAKVKNTLFLIECLHQLHLQDYPAVLVLVGSKQEKDYADRVFETIKSYNLQNFVFYMNSVADVQNVYPAFDLFLGASLREGLGMVAVEAQAAGVPCTLSAGFPETSDIGMSLVQFHNNFNASIWAEAIINSSMKKIQDRVMIRDALRQSGYDMRLEAEKLEQIYMGVTQDAG